MKRVNFFKYVKNVAIAASVVMFFALPSGCNKDDDNGNNNDSDKEYVVTFVTN